MTPSFLREKVHLLAMGEWSLKDFTPIRGATHKVLIKFNY